MTHTQLPACVLPGKGHALLYPLFPSCWMECSHNSGAGAAISDQTCKLCEDNTVGNQGRGSQRHEARNQAGPSVFDEKEKRHFYILFKAL